MVETLGYLAGEWTMITGAREPSDKPNDPPDGGGEDEQPNQDSQERGEGVKESPWPGTTPKDERFTSKGEPIVG